MYLLSGIYNISYSDNIFKTDSQAKCNTIIFESKMNTI